MNELKSKSNSKINWFFNVLVSGRWNLWFSTWNSDSTQKIDPRVKFPGLESWIQVKKWGNIFLNYICLNWIVGLIVLVVVLVVLGVVC